MSSVTDPAAVTPQPAEVVSVRTPRLSLWILRIMIGLHLLLIISQPVSIGQYLSGVFTMLHVHGTVGGIADGTSLLIIAAAVGYALCGGRWWTVPVSIALMIGEGFQVAMGYAGRLAIHVPLGVAIVCFVLVWFGWLWFPSARRGRPRRGALR